MASIDVIFCQELLKKAHALVKEHFPNINLKKDAWVWKAGRDHWEFHGPDKYYWHGSAGNAYDARYHGWMAWLDKQGVLEETEE